MAISETLDDRQAAPEDIGAILRNAREAAGFSIADVAERMRLSRHHIENLEAERFDLFPVSVFLRGYLTSYARLLGIDSVPLLEAYDRRGFGPPQLHSQETAPSTARGSEFTVTLTTLVVIAVLIVLSALWWREQWNEDDLLTSPAPVQPNRGGRPLQTDADTFGTAESTRPDDDFEPRVLPEGESAPDAAEDAVLPSEPEAGTATSPFTDAVPEEAPASDVGRIDESEASPETEAEPGTEPEAPQPETADSGEAETPEPEATETPGPAPDDETARPAAGSAGDLASIVIRVNDDCWLMIRDAEQRLVYRDLAATGTVLELSAAAPVRVVAGYAHGIEVEFNGEPFDLSPYIEQDTGTARFELGD